MSLEQTIAGLEADGLALHNLFRLTSGRYQANVRGGRDERHFFEFAQGDTPNEALLKAIDKAKGVVVPAPRRPVDPAAPVDDLSDLLE